MAFNVPVAGGTLSVERVGSGAPALLLLHGWTLDRRMWRPQVEGLGGHFTLLLPDRRGFGRSPAPPGLAREPDDVPALLDYFGIDRAVLVGHSQAGRVALSAAARHPARVAGLILLAAPHDAVSPDPTREPALPMARLVELVRAGEVAAAHRLWRSHPMLQVTDTATARLLDEMLGDYEGRDLLAPPEPLPVDDGLLAAITCPALVMVGDGDAWSRVQSAARLADGLAQATSLILPGAGHMANISHASACNDTIHRFVLM
ncbi:alpha/beta fold hydrolase [Niveispirillum sp. KHB5.9]|uniref:alpha/beta fold hydrolase n=1 Tax=Niveispirillum sp. KHB5.9 TaxID=3400269 RepID=UPI003A867278